VRGLLPLFLLTGPEDGCEQCSQGVFDPERPGRSYLAIG